jgi:hypothetical protein
MFHKQNILASKADSGNSCYVWVYSGLIFLLYSLLTGTILKSAFGGLKEYI